jgi:ribosomal protein S18 acetylase RimI-like enzyme
MAMALPAVPDKLVTYYLHMTDPAEFQPDYTADTQGVMLMQMRTADVGFYRFLYDTVGDLWRWRDRRLMSDDELRAAISQPNCEIYVLYVDATPAGYVELVHGADGETEIAYFGLRPGYMGRGLGKHLLSFGIARAWDAGARRVTVHTCNLDGPAALPNYQKRGFRVYRTEEEPLPERYLV